MYYCEECREEKSEFGVSYRAELSGVGRVDENGDFEIDPDSLCEQNTWGGYQFCLECGTTLE